MAQWYLSFCDENGFLGACVVEAEGCGEALMLSWLLKINPGGQVIMMSVPDPAKNRLPLHKFMNKAELERYGPIQRIADMEKPPQRIGLN